jgi:hypothetical protein
MIDWVWVTRQVIDIDWYRLYPLISIVIGQYLLLFTIEVLAGTEEISWIIDTERVICELRAKAEETVEHSTYNKAQSDGRTPVDKIKVLFAWKNKETINEKVVEWRKYVMATGQKTNTWLVVFLKRCQLQSFHEVETEHATHYGLSEANIRAFA